MLSACVALFTTVIEGAQNFFGLALRATSLLCLVPSVKARTHCSRVCDKAVSKSDFFLSRFGCALDLFVPIKVWAFTALPQVRVSTILSFSLRGYSILEIIVTVAVKYFLATWGFLIKPLRRLVLFCLGTLDNPLSSFKIPFVTVSKGFYFSIRLGRHLLGGAQLGRTRYSFVVLGR